MCDHFGSAKVTKRRKFVETVVVGSVHRKLLIHIGYHKTGTTWLQTQLFPNEALGLGQVGREFVRRNLIAKRPLEFSAQNCSELLEPEIEKLESRGLHAVVSHEALSGNPYSGGYQSKEMADRLAATFPYARILIVVREQRAMIQSSYQQYVKLGGRAGIEEFIFPPGRWSSRIPLFSLENFKYHLLAQYYQRLFGASNVLVVPYELFVSEPVEFVTLVLKFAGLNPDCHCVCRLPLTEKCNVTPPWFSLEVKRRLNFLYPISKHHRLETTSVWERRRREFVDEISGLVGRLVPKAWQDKLKQEQSDWIDRTVGNMYMESNEMLATICGIDLRRFGYRMPVHAMESQLAGGIGLRRDPVHSGSRGYDP
ncbi:MAG TPA: sulfotransferase [Candidatus Obscuribacterales bacterium]